MRIHHRARRPHWVEISHEGKRYHETLTLVDCRTVIDREALARSRGARWTVAFIEGTPSEIGACGDHPVRFDPSLGEFTASGEVFTHALAVHLSADGRATALLPSRRGTSA